jgi:hypothetical protein
MTKPINNLSLAELRKHVVSEYRAGAGTRPDVLVIDYEGDQAVLKDHNQCDFWFGLILGPLLAWREAKALTRLKDLEGVPVLVSRPDRRSLLMEHLPGVQVVRYGGNAAWPEYFVHLSGLISDMHDIGVAHCDLRSPTNVLVADGNRPVLVDFAACFCRGSRINFIANPLFRQFVRVDRSAEIKLKRYVAPELLTADDMQSENVGGRAGQFFRRVGMKARDISRALFAAGPSPKKK